MFLEFSLFSDTQFYEYSHRTYEATYMMYNVIYTYYQRIAQSNDILTLDAADTVEKYNVHKVLYAACFYD